MKSNSNSLCKGVLKRRILYGNKLWKVGWIYSVSLLFSAEHAIGERTTSADVFFPSSLTSTSTMKIPTTTRATMKQTTISATVMSAKKTTTTTMSPYITTTRQPILADKPKGGAAAVAFHRSAIAVSVSASAAVVAVISTSVVGRFL